MKVLVIFWIVFSSRAVFANDAMTETQASIVLSLAEHFRVAFCAVGKDGRSVALAPSGMLLSKDKLLTGWLTFDEISNLLNNDLGFFGGRAMIVVKMENTTIKSLSQLSEARNLSPAIWLVLSEYEFEHQLFRDIYIPFDCEFLVVSENNSFYTITELYQIKKDSPIESYNFGNWTKEEGLFLTDSNFYERRSSLKGYRFKGLIKNDPPYVFIRKHGEGNSSFGGYLYEIWSEIEHRLNFRTEFPENYFDQNPEEILQKEEIDFVVARIPSEPSSFQSVDFSLPINKAKFYMFAHRPGSELDWDSYLKPFSADTWLVNLAWMICSSVALAILYKIAWDSGTSEREARYFVFTFSESLLTVFRAICMQGSDVTPRSSSCRLLFLSIYLTALVVTSAFSAALFSLLTIPKPRSPFNSLDEVLNNRKFKLGFPSDPDFHKLVEEFSKTLVLPKQIKLLEKLMETKGNLLVTPEEGLQRLCSDRNYIFVFDLPNVLFLMQNMTRSCQDKILPSGPPLFSQFIGFGFGKDNPYKRLINFHLIRMKNEGILKRLLLNYWPPQIPSVQATWVRVTLADISPILYMFALGAVLGVLLLYAEKIALHLRQRSIYLGAVSGLNRRVSLNPTLILVGKSKSKVIPDWESLYEKKGKKEPKNTNFLN